MDKNQEKIYTEIDVESLCLLLAEDEWESTTLMNPIGELYETVVGPEGQTKIQVTDRWAQEYWALVKQFKLLCNQYSRYPVPEEEID